jgi:excisionase family DNA binding protein
MEIERKTLSLDEVAKALGVSRGSIYKAARNNELPTIKLGHRILVPKAALDRLLSGEQVAA